MASPYRRNVAKKCDASLCLSISKRCSSIGIERLFRKFCFFWLLKVHGACTGKDERKEMCTGTRRDRQSSSKTRDGFCKNRDAFSQGSLANVEKGSVWRNKSLGRSNARDAAYSLKESQQALQFETVLACRSRGLPREQLPGNSSKN
jgi:hypothetical protein